MAEKNYFDNLGRYMKAISIFRKYFIKKNLEWESF